MTAPHRHATAQLIRAIRHFSVPEFQAALEAGADPHHARVRDGGTLLHLLALHPSKGVDERTEHKERTDTVVEAQALLLLSMGADINAQDRHGYTPLHLAVEHQAHVLVRTLLTTGARVDILDHDHRTPMHTWTALSRGRHRLPEWIQKARRLPSFITNVWLSHAQATIELFLQHTRVADWMNIATPDGELPFSPWRKEAFMAGALAAAEKEALQNSLDSKESQAATPQRTRRL